MSPGRDPGGGARSPEPPERRDRGTTRRFRKQRQLRPALCSGDPGRRSVPRARARTPPAMPIPSPFTPVQPSAWRRVALRPAAPSRPLLLGARGLRPARSGGRGQPPTPVIASPPGAAVMNEPRTRVLSGIDAVISSYWRRDAGRNREHASGPPLAVRGGGRSGAGSGRDGCRGPAHVLAPGSALSRPPLVCCSGSAVPGSRIGGRAELHEVPSGACVCPGVVRADCRGTPQSPLAQARALQGLTLFRPR